MSFTLSDAVVLIRQEGANRIGPEVAREIEGSSAGGSAGLGFAKKLVAGALAFGIGAKIASNMGESIDLASDLNETISKSSTIFGANQAAMMSWSTNAATGLGLSQGAALSAASSFGDMFTQIGFTGDAAAEMSRGVVQASADLGSFSNLDTADVADRMSAAFRGEYDSLQAVIPNINAARVESEAMAATGKTTAAALTAQEKATAVLAIVQKDGARAMGDFGRTSEGYANQQKIAAAQTEDLKAKIGAGLLPIFAAGAGVLTGTLLPALSALADIALARVVPGAVAAADAIDIWSSRFTGLSYAIRTGNVAGFLQEAFGFTPPPELLAYFDSIRDRVQATFPALLEVGSRVAEMFMGTLWPAIQNIAQSLATAGAETGVSSWQLFVSVLQIAAPLLEALAQVVLLISQWMLENQGVVNLIVVAYTAWTVAQWALNAAMLANPIGLVVAAIVLLIAGIVALVMNWDTVVAFLTSTWAGFVGWFTGVMDGFLAWWNGLWTAIVTWVQTTFGPIVLWIQETWSFLVLIFQTMGAILAAWWNQLWTNIVAWFLSTFGPLIEIARQLMELWSLGWQVIGAVLSAWWSAMWSAISSFFQGLFGPLVAWAIATWTSLQAGFAAIGAAISAWWGSMWSAIGSFFRSTFGPAIEWGKSTWSSLSSAFQSVGNTLASWWSGLWSGITSGFSAAVGTISGLVSNVIGFFTNMQSQVTGALSGAANWLYDAGKRIIDGLTRGIRETVGNVASAITSGLDSAISGAKAFLGIASPSKLAQKVIGRWILPGVAEGIEDTTPALQRTMTDAVQLPSVPSNVVPISAARSARGGDVYNIDITVDASNLREVEDVIALFHDLKRAARMGGKKEAA